jgi:hypothetical protein
VEDCKVHRPQVSRQPLGGPTGECKSEAHMLSRVVLLGIVLVGDLSCSHDDPTSPTPTTKEFTIPLSVGTTWVYQYSYRSSYHLMEWYETHGVHTWRVLTAEAGSLPRTYGLTASTRDTVHHTMITGQSTMLDTTYVLEQSTPFSAILSQDSLILGWASMAQVRPGSPDPLQRIPRVVAVGADTLILSIGSSGVGGVATYLSGVGLIKYDAVMALSTSTYEKHLALLTVSVKGKPQRDDEGRLTSGCT